MKLMIAVSAVHLSAFEAVPWAPPANDDPEPVSARVRRVRRNHEAAPSRGVVLTQQARIAVAR